MSPDVLAIGQAIYRTGAESELMRCREAVRRGKEVTLVLELKARFDEEAKRYAHFSTGNYNPERRGFTPT